MKGKPMDNRADERVRRLALWAEREREPRVRAKLYGKLICEVLDLESIREGLSFAGIATLSNAGATELADHMREVLAFREPWGTWNRRPDPERIARAWGTIRDFDRGRPGEAGEPGI